jgi:hypothetical protein
LAGSVTDAFEVDLLKAVTGQATTILTTTPLTNVFVALTTTTPTDSAAGTEVTGGSYARVQTVGSWGAPSSPTSSVSNNAAITFPAPTANWGTVVAFELWSASSAGTRLAWGTLTTNKTVNNGDAAPSFAIAALTITCD